MKEIVVNDTNILIDMHAAGLLEYVRSSPYYWAAFLMIE